MVPVLSRITKSSLPAVCRASPWRISAPYSAALPTPTITDMGVARPRAQGQAMIRTVVAAMIICTTAGSGPTLYQTSAAATAISITLGTNTDDILSASRPMAGFEPWAFFTRWIIWAKAVSLPTRVASYTMAPWVFSVPAETSSSTPLLTGMGSPVSMLSSIRVLPSTTRPSTGRFSPGRTRM